MWGHLAVSAVVANAIPYTLFAVAEQNVSSSLAGVINATTPLWTVGFALIARTEAKLTTRRIFGVALGFVGVVTILEPWNGTTSGPSAESSPASQPQRATAWHTSIKHDA